MITLHKQPFWRNLKHLGIVEQIIVAGKKLNCKHISSQFAPIGIDTCCIKCGKKITATESNHCKHELLADLIDC